MNRDRFPGLAGSWVRLDGPAGTQMVDAAIEAMAAFMRSGDNANHGGVFAAAHATDACVERARASVARLLGADEAGVAFGPSMTAMTMRLSAAVGRTLGPGDEVVVTRLDHDANVRPWVIAAERAGAAVRWAEPDRETLALPASAIEAVLSDRTRWVAVTAASNATGTVPELDGIIAAAHAAGAKVAIDAVAASPHRALSLRDLGADTIVCSAYKWYGPHIGILCAAPALLEELRPDKLIVSPDEAPDRFELGTLPFESLAGVAAAADYLLEVGFDAIRAHEEALMGAALEGLRGIDGVTLYGDPPDRVPTLMFNVDGLTSAQAATALAEREIAVWDGNYYAYELERFLGLDPDGAVRAGFVHYNDADDVRRLVEGVAEVAGLDRAPGPVGVGGDAGLAMLGALRFARMAGSSLAAPDAAGWVTDFLNAAYYARPPAERHVADLRLAYGIVTTRWDRLGRRLRVHDAIAFHRAFGVDRFVRSPRLTLTHEQLLEGGARLLGDWFGDAWRDPERRGWGVAFSDPAGRAAYVPEARLRDAALGQLSAPGAAEEQRHWSTYPAVAVPSADAAIATLSDTSRWPDFGCAGGRFTALRSGGLAGQTFEIEVVAHPAPRTPVFTRGYVTATGLHTEPAAILERLGRAALEEPALPEGATPRLLLELTTHEGHFLGPAVSRLVVWEEDGAAFIRDVGEWDPLAAHLAVPFRLAGRAAQVAFWGGGPPEQSMLHQLAAVVADETSTPAG